MHYNRGSISTAILVAITTVAGIFLGVISADAQPLTAGDHDWPMWRHDAGRTAETPESLPAQVQLRWMLNLPPLKPAFRNERLHFDAGYEPIVVGDLMVVGSSVNDSVTAYSIDTGQLQWRYYTEGPVRFAPAAFNDSVLFGSDDGCLYCLDLRDGQLRWRFRAVGRSRKLLGNGRLISVWPVRGGPVVADGCVYFAAGVWPSEGVFVYALDAATGEVVWLNDRLGYLYGQHPHSAEAFGGLSPQGYLVVNGEDLIVPCGSAYPATLNRKTGELVEFQLPKPGREPGGWFAAVDKSTARDVRRGTVVYDNLVNRQRHEDRVYQGTGVPGVRSRITVGGKELEFADRIVYSMLAARSKLFVVTRDGSICCFGAGPAAQAANDEATRTPSVQSDNQQGTSVARLIEIAGASRGYAVVCGLDDGRLVDALIQTTNFHVIAIDADRETVARLRERFDRAGLYGTRVAILTGTLADVDLPPYFANLITSETPQRLLQDVSASVPAAFRSLRPYGGTLCVEASQQQSEAVAGCLARAGLAGAVASFESGFAVVRRPDGLPGAVNYTGGWQTSDDALVRAPLGVLWFDDSLGHFKRSPQPTFVDGVMISYPKHWPPPKPTRTNTVDYPLLGPVLSDVYTGRVLADDEAVALRGTLPIPDPERPEPSQYRPPTQHDDWNPDPPIAGERTNPLTGRKEPRAFPKSYGCDGGYDYGSLYTMRSGTAAFYDKTNESGTINISGPRSGCTNSILPACGLLNLPYFYEGCTCSYPLPTGAALIHMPDSYEQWTAWGLSKPDSIQRIGINFGAPGDRVTRGGTLWLDVPSVGGPSPEIDVEIQPDAPTYYYRHSLWVESGTGWPWVAASGAEGLSSFTLRGLKPGKYTARLTFAERPDRQKGERIQDVILQGQTVLQNLDIVDASGGTMRSIVREFSSISTDGSLTVKLSAGQGKTLISGIELIRDGLPLEPLTQ